MKTLNGYTLAELQTFKAMLESCKRSGIVNPDFIVKEIDSMVRQETEKRKYNGPVKICPSCFLSALIESRNSGSLNVLACPKCRYSEVVT